MFAAHRLSKPIERRDCRIEELTIAEADGEAMLIVDDHMVDGKIEKPIAMQMKLIACLAEVDGRRGEITFNDVRRMSAEDIAALGELVSDRLPGGPQTGPKASR